MASTPSLHSAISSGVFAVPCEPIHINHVRVGRVRLHLCLEIVSRHALEAEEHVIQRTIEMVFADIAGEECAAFIRGARENCVPAEAGARAAGGLFGEVFYEVHRE